MNKTKLLYLVISLLIVSNIVLLFFISKIKSERMHPDKPRNEIIRRLKFDPQQVEKYDKTILHHREDIRKITADIFETKSKLYTLLIRQSDTGKIRGLIVQLGNQQMELEQIHFNHFLEIKQLCHEDQLSEFERLTKDLIEIFRFTKQPPHKDTKRH